MTAWSMPVEFVPINTARTSRHCGTGLDKWLVDSEQDGVGYRAVSKEKVTTGVCWLCLFMKKNY